MKNRKNTTIIEGYESKTLRDLCADVYDIAIPQFDFAYESFKNLLPEDLVKRIDKVIVSGCGDSYLAGKEAVQVFKHYLAGAGVEMVAPTIIEASRYLPMSDNENTLVVGVSASGSPARVEELLERAKSRGYKTLALTNNPESRAANSADYVYLTNTPSDSPGLKSFYASQISLFVMAAAIAEIRTDNTKLVENLREQLVLYNEEFFKSFDEIDNLCSKVSEEWKDMQGFEVIADGPIFASGEFVAAKYMEAAGEMCTVIDSEDYMHVNAGLRPKGKFGTIVMVVSDESNLSRIIDTTNRAIKEHKRPVLFISDKSAEELGVKEEVTSCIIPAPEKEYRFLLTLYSYIPGSILAGNHAALHDEPYFRGGPANFKDKSIFTVGSSEVKLV